ncbi:DUF1177 family protein [Acidianus sulfidivorans JP7]|uniref:DUF1177 domain-containing protein n=1 Tax=Acidianus sulfidivorans JP7 TaxID=619593 RepID=A0A2U9ILR3_9CREN|nr:DUF1177 family protein [Acidianus sulfidivorans]AWR96854.1 DUF1177 family protein [Acidianus sulfidivorans JP7]
MIMKTLLDIIEILESKNPISALEEECKKYDIELQEKRLNNNVIFIKAKIGKGKKKAEVLGRLGAIKISDRKGIVSDADGAIISITSMIEWAKNYSEIEGEAIFSTNVSLDASLIPHKPFNFMVPLVGLDEALKLEVDNDAQFIISIDSTKGNRIAKYNDFAITHIVKDGYILKVPDEIIDIYEKVTEHEPYFVALTSGDLTPMEIKAYHISTLISPWLYTEAPVLGVATVSKYPIPGYETGVQNITMLERAARFSIEVLKYYFSGGQVYSQDELNSLKNALGESQFTRLKKNNNKKQ